MQLGHPILLPAAALFGGSAACMVPLYGEVIPHGCSLALCTSHAPPVPDSLISLSSLNYVC